MTDQKHEVSVTADLTLKQESKPATAAEKATDVDAKIIERLDESAKTLLTATTLAIAVLGAVGLNSDRIPAVFNSPDQWWVVIGLVLAGASVVLAVCALAAKSARTETWFVIASALAFLLSIAMIVEAAGHEYTANGRPTITSVSAKPSTDRLAEVSFKVRADGVDRDSHLTVYAINLQPTGEIVYSTVLRPDDKGVVAQEVSFTLDMPKTPTQLSIQAYRAKDVGSLGADAKSLRETGRSCSEQSDQETAPACATVNVPAAASKSNSQSPSTLRPATNEKAKQ